MEMPQRRGAILFGADLRVLILLLMEMPQRQDIAGDYMEILAES